MSARRVVLTGRGLVSPLGVGIDQHWEALSAARTAIAPVARLGALGLPTSRGAQIAPHLLAPHLNVLPRKQQKLYNRATLLAMLAASLAMEDAGLATGAGDPGRFGVLLGVNTSSWDLASMTEYLIAAESRDSPGNLDMSLANAFCMRSINPLDYSLKTLPNLTAGHLAIAHDAQGLCRALTEGPLGGAHAVGQAYRMIAEGELEVALCGGSDAQLDELVFATSAGLGLLPPDGGAASETVHGEGSGVLVLESAERAKSRGAPVYGEVTGFALAAGDGLLAPREEAPRLAGRLARVIREAVGEAGRLPDLVALHGDGAQAHDEGERIALARVLGPAAGATVSLSMKRAHGDLGAASSPVEILACSTVMRHGIIPSIISRVSDALPSAPCRSLVIAIGLFGECAALVLERADAH